MEGKQSHDSTPHLEKLMDFEATQDDAAKYSTLVGAAHLYQGMEL